MIPTSTARAARPWLVALLLVVMAGTAGTNAPDPVRVAVALGLAVLASVAVLAGVALPAPGRWAGPLLVLNGAAVATYLSLDLAPGPVYLTVALSTFVVALSRPTWTWVRWSVPSLLVLAVGSAVGWARGTVGAVEAVWPWLGMVALAVAAGVLATMVGVRAEARGDRAERAAAEERLRMAQDLHDGVGHGLAVIAMQAGVALHVLERDPGAARGSLEAIRDTSRQSLDQLREELARLAGPQRAAARRPAPGSTDLCATLDRVRAGGLAVDLRVLADGMPLATVEDLDLPVEAEVLVHRVVQESLTNVLRHADARRVRVALSSASGLLEIEILDDGHGPRDDLAPGLGLRGMRARVEAAGGELTTGRGGHGARGGFCVRVRVPVAGGVRS